MRAWPVWLIEALGRASRLIARRAFTTGRDAVRWRDRLVSPQPQLDNEDRKSAHHHWGEAAMSEEQASRLEQPKKSSRFAPIGHGLAQSAVLTWRFVRGPEPSSRTDWFKKLIDVATLTVIAIGLYFAFFQASKLADSINSATWNSVASQELNLDKILIDYPEARKYFYSGAHLAKDDPDYDRVASIADLFLDFMDGYYSSAKYLSIQVSDPEKWEAWFVEIFSNSPITCDRLKNSRDEYSDELLAVAAKPCRWDQ
jgi:hypothetical protein